jgi:hypothetical protein
MVIFPVPNAMASLNVNTRFLSTATAVSPFWGEEGEISLGAVLSVIFYPSKLGGTKFFPLYSIYKSNVESII